MWNDSTTLANEVSGHIAGGMAERVRDFDWESTPLGASKDWPPELKTVVRHIVEGRFPMAVVWGPHHTTIYNDAFRPLLGNKPEALGRSFADVWAEAWDSIGPIADRAYAGEATYIEDYPLVIDRTGTPEQAYFTFCYSPLRLEDGSVGGMIDTVIETTDTVRARADLDLLNKELGHRLKNTLSLVQAIAAQTLKGVDEDAVDAFRERIVALAKAHDVLLQQDWATASLGAIVRETLAPLDGLQQIVISGPEVQAGSRAALTLSLILHELATNAAKYGALSVPDGCVALQWSIDDGMFRLNWSERDGPPVRRPDRTGFGSRLIRRGLSTSGSVECRYLPDGFEMDLSAPEQDLIGT